MWKSWDSLSVWLVRVAPHGMFSICLFRLHPSKITSLEVLVIRYFTQFLLRAISDFKQQRGGRRRRKFDVRDAITKHVLEIYNVNLKPSSRFLAS